MNISLLTFCHGRRSEALETVPRSASELGENDELVYVDYDCPQHTADALALMHLRKVRIIRAVGLQWFHMDHARNLAGRAAKNEMLLFTDVDHWTPRAVLEEARRIPAENYGIMPDEITNWGWLAVRKSDFYKVQGYEEALTAYGHDDFQMRRTLDNLGRTPIVLSHRIECVQKRTDREQGFRPLAEQFRHHQVPHRSRTNAANVAVARALRMLHPWKNNVSRNWGWNGTIQSDNWKPDAWATH